MTQTSIQVDAEWRKMIDALSEKWGIMGATKILRSCTERVYMTEILANNQNQGEMTGDIGHPSKATSNTE